MKIKVDEATGPSLNWLVMKCEGGSPDRKYTPSSDWAQGGPIIEREGISLIPNQPWTAELENNDFFIISENGHTPLIAAMRCYVVSKLGEVVEVPKEML